VDDKRRKKESSEEQIAWKLENDDVTNCILNSWLNENTDDVFVDDCSLENDSFSCADFDEESFEYRDCESMLEVRQLPRKTVVALTTMSQKRRSALEPYQTFPKKNAILILVPSSSTAITKKKKQRNASSEEF
jgi:hypothetical protein